MHHAHDAGKREWLPVRGKAHLNLRANGKWRQRFQVTTTQADVAEHAVHVRTGTARTELGFAAEGVAGMWTFLHRRGSESLLKHGVRPCLTLRKYANLFSPASV